MIINDTDVKRMPRLELKERLRGIIHQQMAEAASLAGVKNTLHIQTYLLTDFWESVKDASPVIFTFIRDGIPIYDRGTFMPWKTLLRMGKLKPSPESIDMFMKTADKTKEMIDSVRRAGRRRRCTAGHAGRRSRRSPSSPSCAAAGCRARHDWPRQTRV